MKNYEPTQRGNPHELTIKQHVFPKRSIDRFCDSNGGVEIFIKNLRKITRVDSRSELFCAHRAWDQRSESLFMKSIEDRFQSIADSIIRDADATWLHFCHEDVSRFFALWTERFHALISPSRDLKINGMTKLERALTKDSQEALEKAHVIFFNNDLTLPGRILTGVRIDMATMRRVESLSGVRWGIWRAKPGAGTFIVPDYFATYMVIPISPDICLVGDAENRYIGRSEIVAINQIAFSSSQRHFFAANLSQCPLVV
jgi:hypothetical protein